MGQGTRGAEGPDPGPRFFADLQAGPFRYTRESRPCVAPGTVVLDEVCGEPHVLLEDMAGLKGVLRYACAAVLGAPTLAVRYTVHTGALGDLLVDGLKPLPPALNGSGKKKKLTAHHHVCQSCRRSWPHRARFCCPVGMVPKRCPRCDARMAAAAARWAHVKPAEEGRAAKSWRVW